MLFPACLSPYEGRRYGRGLGRGCRGPEYTGLVTSSVTAPRVKGDEAYIGRAGLLTLVFVDIPHTHKVRPTLERDTRRMSTDIPFLEREYVA